MQFCASHGDEFKHFLIPFQHASRYRRKRESIRASSKVGNNKKRKSADETVDPEVCLPVALFSLCNAAEAARGANPSV